MIAKSCFLLIPVLVITLAANAQETIWEQTERAFQLAEQANFVASYDMRERMDIGVGALSADPVARQVIDFDLDELTGFFDKQRHKDLIVVIIEKHVWPDEKLAEEVERLKTYFIARGYRRICIQQASAVARGIHLDYRVEAEEEANQ